MIFYKKDLESKIDFAVFPGLQGGPHNNNIAALATQLLEVSKPEFKEYIIQVKNNAKTLANYLLEKDFELVSGGTDNHLLLIDLKNKGMSGGKLEFICEEVDISLNKNSVITTKIAVRAKDIKISRVPIQEIENIKICLAT